ncbi:MAG: hypothetical protein ACYCUM_00035 [Solirubrobacteraceae bacterium]
MLGFAASITVLSVVQGASVALPGPRAAQALRNLRAPGSQHLLSRLTSRWWALLPPVSIAAFVLVGAFAATASATALTYFALIGVPIGAALALGVLVHWARAPLAIAVVPLFALAWADRGGLPGEAAAVVISVLSCATLGALFAAVTPPRWLAGGILAMSALDVALVSSELLQRPNNALNAARPAAGLPQLQAELFGSAAMGYGDIFVAGLLGGLLLVTLGARVQRLGALLAVVLSLAFDLLFLLVGELPATVPIAGSLLVLHAARGVRRRRRRA